MRSAPARVQSGTRQCGSCSFVWRWIRRRQKHRARAPRPKRKAAMEVKTKMAKKPNGYTAEDIEILEDLSPILHRPGMYTDPVNPNHALVEIIDNSADDGLAGLATKVSVTLFEGGSAAVEA